MLKKIVNISGIKFADVNLDFLKKKLKEKKYFFVFPAAPALINIKKDKEYYVSLKSADYVLFDSGYLCLLLRIFKNINVSKFSGLKFLKFFLKLFKNDKSILFVIDPNKESSKKNINLLKTYKIRKIKNYIAPIYKGKKVVDLNLLKILKKTKPGNILINLGGGTQEKLGFYLKKKLAFNANIICTGAAISFLTREQAYIPDFIDKLYLGWFFRILYNPKGYFIRYFKALKLLELIIKTKVNVK